LEGGEIDQRTRPEDQAHKILFILSFEGKGAHLGNAMIYSSLVFMVFQKPGAPILLIYTPSSSAVLLRSMVDINRGIKGPRERVDRDSGGVGVGGVKVEECPKATFD
jgi:hypothetical protein